MTAIAQKMGHHGPPAALGLYRELENLGMCRVRSIAREDLAQSARCSATPKGSALVGEFGQDHKGGQR